MDDVQKVQQRIATIRQTLKDGNFTRAHPLHAGELDLERKVLENDLRGLSGEPRQYHALHY